MVVKKSGGNSAKSVQSIAANIIKKMSIFAKDKISLNMMNEKIIRLLVFCCLLCFSAGLTAQEVIFHTVEHCEGSSFVWNGTNYGDTIGTIVQEFPDSTVIINVQSIQQNYLAYNVSTIYPQQYAACQGVQVTMGFVNTTGINYYWFANQTGGTSTSTGATKTVIKNSSDLETFWAEARKGSCIYPRKRIELHKGFCGRTDAEVITANDCSSTGNVLFKEDFDSYGSGTITTSPNYSTEPLPTGRTTHGFVTTYPEDGYYALAKTTGSDKSDWVIFDDHTLPNSQVSLSSTCQSSYTSQPAYSTRTGRFMLVNANNNVTNPLVFYEQTITDLCPGSKLSFITWVANCHCQTTMSKPNLTFTIYDATSPIPANQKKILVFNTGDIPVRTAGISADWRQWGCDVVTQENITSLRLNITNNQSDGGGNDLGLDDIEVRICVPDLYITPDSVSVCEGDPVTLSAPDFDNNGIFQEPLEYLWYRSSTGNDPWTPQTSFIQDHDSLYFAELSPADTGYYRLAISAWSGITQNRINCTTYSNAVHLTFLPFSKDSMSQEICELDSFLFNGRWLKEEGLYCDTLEHANYLGCDSIVTLYLTVNPLESDTIYAEICQGETYRENGFIQNTSGTYLRRDTTAFGCGRAIYLKLTVNPCCEGYDTVVVCKENFPYHYNGHVFNIEGNYAVVYSKACATGCDSTLYLHIIKDEVKVFITQGIDFCDEYVTTLSAKTETSPVFYLWNTGETSPEITVDLGGEYSVTAFNETGCEGRWDHVIPPCIPLVVLPSAITPLNKDGLNDYFYLPQADQLESAEIYIYDRYGMLVFHSTSKNFQWDGNYRKNVIYYQTYNYVLIVRDFEGKTSIIKGRLTVL
jgi:gliding motility-associated-like protein